MSWQVPGYVLQELLGFGGSGEVWRARSVSSGRQVSVKRLRGAAARGRTRWLEQVVGAVAHPHLAAPYEVHTVGEDLAVVAEYLSGGSLAAIVETRRLTPGEVVTILIPVAAALQHAHDQGLAHGAVTPTNILFTPDGRPVLTDLAIAEVAGDRDEAPGLDRTATAERAAGSDVFGLAAVGFWCLAGVPVFDSVTGERHDLRQRAPETPAALISVIERVLAAGADTGDSAADFAAAVRAAAAPEPVELPVTPRPGGVDEAVTRVEAPVAVGHQPVDGRRRTGGRHAAGVRRPDRTRAKLASGRRPTWLADALRSRLGTALVAGIVAVIAVAAAIWMGGLWAGAEAGPRAAERDGGPTVSASVAGPSAPTGSATPASSSASVEALTGDGSPDRPADWRQTVQDLYDERVSAFTAADPAPLSAVYAPGSSQLQADQEAVQALADAGRTLSGFDLVVESIQVIEVGTERADLRVVDSYGPFEIVSGGEVIARDPGRPPADVSMVLVRTTEGWRILSSLLEP